MRYATCRSTFARIADPIGAFKESLEVDIGTIGHRIYARPLTRYAGAADVLKRCASAAGPLAFKRIGTEVRKL